MPTDWTGFKTAANSAAHAAPFWIEEATTGRRRTTTTIISHTLAHQPSRQESNFACGRPQMDVFSNSTHQPGRQFRFDSQTHFAHPIHPHAGLSPHLFQAQWSPPPSAARPPAFGESASPPSLACVRILRRYTSRQSTYPPTSTTKRKAPEPEPEPKQLAAAAPAVTGAGEEMPVAKAPKIETVSPCRVRPNP